jgi:hypothetical protein
VAKPTYKENQWYQCLLEINDFAFTPCQFREGKFYIGGTTIVENDPLRVQELRLAENRVFDKQPGIEAARKCYEIIRRTDQEIGKLQAVATDEIQTIINGVESPDLKDVLENFTFWYEDEDAEEEAEELVANMSDKAIKRAAVKLFE